MTQGATIPVLLVDDRPENLIALEGILDNMGLEIFKASSGNEALGLLLKHDFALVLMDVRMPEMDGFETAELIRANPRTRNLPIIFVTAAMKDADYEFRGYEAGGVDYLLKPIEPLIMRSKVKILCDLYQQRQDIARREQQLETLVKERTAALHEANEQLQIELRERQRAEEKILRLNEELEQRVRERTQELEQKNYELGQMNKVFVGRELRMIELKEKIKELEEKTKNNPWPA